MILICDDDIVTMVCAATMLGDTGIFRVNEFTGHVVVLAKVSKTDGSPWHG